MKKKLSLTLLLCLYTSISFSAASAATAEEESETQVVEYSQPLSQETPQESKPTRTITFGKTTVRETYSPCHAQQMKAMHRNPKPRSTRQAQWRVSQAQKTQKRHTPSPKILTTEQKERLTPAQFDKYIKRCADKAQRLKTLESIQALTSQQKQVLARYLAEATSKK